MGESVTLARDREKEHRVTRRVDQCVAVGFERAKGERWGEKGGTMKVEGKTKET